MPDPAFHEVPIAEMREETPELVHLALHEVPAELQNAYSVPGQYVQMKAGEAKPAFLAMACGPGRGALEFLIKRGNPSADAILSRKAGEKVAITVPGGKGYPMAEARGRDLVFFGVGSGITPLRAAIHEVLKDRGAFKSARLIYGARKAAGFPYATEMETWPAQGVEVVRVVSQPEPGSWNGETGRVQEIFRRGKPQLAPDTCVFVCGMKDMVAGVKQVLAELGLPAERVFLNF